ncbi:MULTISPECIES: enoyl-CoA hydratase-related protein [unclassified Mycolicibacterium]|uniref:enoyl-CoA hydratase/isomerase family protein n=1 Tax=unclassified Mycolicibacterium TaxID=2636767 RepID=UPI001F4C4781|nr:enoyl-CoA hydratase-related protein [Mycolicibacterium sp. YH-1]UNB52153.1 enoyl-CoA hydratase-related protein [Mycolicibacterium sp. YH-1]
MSDGIAIRSEQRGSVLVLTLARGAKANTLTVADMSWIADAMAAAVTNDAVRAVLIRAEGTHFCGGADLFSVNAAEERPRTGATMRMLNSAAHRMVQAIWDCSLPTVAAVQGRAAGVGLHLALATDFVIAGESASFQEPFRERGFTADSGATFLLPRLIGLARAKQLLLLGRAVKAAEALEWGLVTETHGDLELQTASYALAEELAAGPTFSLELTKSMLNKHVTSDLATSMSEEAALVQLSLHGQDFKEGIKAFRERRPAQFTGR